MSKFTFKHLNRHFPYMLLILKTGIPSAIQGAVFCFANFFVQAAINGFGSEAIAGCTIAMTFEYFAYYVITAFGQTATTFTSQNYAAGQIKRCRQILLICTVFSILSSSLIIVPIILFKAEFSGIFSTNEAVITNSCIRIMCILVFEPMCCLYEIPSGVLRGCGHALQPAVITIIGTCAFRIIWIYTVFRHFHSLEILYAAFPITWVITTVLMLGSFVIIRPFCRKNA